VEPLEIALALCLVGGFVAGMISRAFATFSCARLEGLVERRLSGADASAVKAVVARKTRSREEVSFSASLARDLLAVAVAVLAVASGGWRFAGPWLAAWVAAVGVLARALGASLAEGVVYWLGPVARVALLPARPLGFFVLLAEKAVDRLTGKAERDSVENEIEEEIRAIVAEGRTEGVLDERAGEMIESVLKFRDADVAEIMTPRTEMISIPSDATLDQAIAIARDAGHSRLPVHEGNRDNIVGIFYVKDLLRHWGAQPPPAVRDIMRKPHFIPESRKVSGLMEELRKANVHIAIVLDEYGGTAGIVTVEDIVEEVVGEISDEFDRKTEPTWKRQDDGVVLADARVHVDELNEACGFDLPESEEYDTIGGLVTSVLGRIPRPGERVTSGRAEIEVADADARRIKTVRLRPAPAGQVGTSRRGPDAPESE
jgi:CBS domain containing-hemolysin-like protein